MSEITDEDLTAFLDGELGAEDAARVSAALAASPELEARLNALQVPLAGMRSAFEGVLAQAPEAPELPEPSTRLSLIHI